MQILILMVVEIFTLILQRIFCDSVLTKKVRNRAAELLAWCGYYAIFSAGSYLIPLGVWFRIMLFMVSFFIALRIVYTNPVRTLLGVTAFMYLGGMCSELIVYYGKFLFPERLQPGGESFYMVLCKLIYLIFIKMMATVIKRVRRVELNFLDWMEVFVVPVGSIFILLALFSENSDMSQPAKLWAVIAVLTINIFTYYLYDKARESLEGKLREEILAKQCEYYVRQYNASQEWWQELRHFRHDMKQHYLLEKMYVEAEDYDSLRKYCDDNLDFTDRKSTVSNTGNLYFDSIINYKADAAGLQGITLATDIRIPADIEVQPEDLSICLGNLLDNAIEAVGELPEERRINLRIFADGSNLYIEVRNKYQGQAKKHNGKYLSGKKDIAHHGYGLEIVKRIVAKYEGNLQIRDEEQEFEVEVVLYHFANNG